MSSVSGPFLPLDAAGLLSTRQTGVRVTPRDLKLLNKVGLLPLFPDENTLPVLARKSDIERLGGSIQFHAELDDLFADLTARFAASSIGAPQRSTNGMMEDEVIPAGLAFLVLSPSFAISFPSDFQHSESLQLFLSKIRKEGIDRRGPLGTELLRPSVLRHEVDRDLLVWTSVDVSLEHLQRLWRASVCSEAATTFSDAMCIPRIYGNKARITSFLVAIAKHYIPAGGSILDLMSGTGVVSQRLASDFDVFSNDANFFAAHLTRFHTLNISIEALKEFFARMKEPYQQNSESLIEALHSEIECEAKFLHGEVNDTSLEKYVAFCDSAQDTKTVPGAMRSARRRHTQNNIAPMLDSTQTISLEPPYSLATSHFANAYFGLAQSVALDSLRYAIDKVAVGQVREFLLDVLLLTACSCASGPHFAQPPKLTSLRAMKEVVEHRSRDVLGEFELTAGLLVESRRPTRLNKVTQGNWREALAKFAADVANSSQSECAVYVDPPYTKLQYSRYYHVLDTLLHYDYPGAIGQGRYPPKQFRFSSRFEYQPAASKKELFDVIAECARHRLVCILSYSDKGFVPIRNIIPEMEQKFRSVDVYSTVIRHHSQGVTLGSSRKQVTEYVIVGR